MEQPVFTVSQVNQFIKSLLDAAPTLTGMYVQGEVCNYKRYPSGHHYFTLKDAESVIRCVMFRAQAAHLRFQPGNGMKVIAMGRVSVFSRDGAYQLYCDRVVPEGAGDLHAAFEQLKAKLFQAGLFNPAHKKPLPPYPRAIALVTSSAGAAVHDMIRILRRRYPLAKVKLLPVRVQGTEAPWEIAQAIQYANRYQVADLLITGRGGGSMEDLWAFNDERVAWAIYQSRIPVISAVGHEPDVTIADFVADVRASTPSHAAELAVPDQAELMVRLRRQHFRMVQAQEKRLRLLRQRLDNLAAKRVLTEPLAAVETKAMLLDRVQRDLHHAALGCLTEPRRRLAALSAALDALSPLKVLGRGYAVVTGEDGTILREVREVPPGSHITAALAHGRLHCLVESVEDTAVPRF